jgi:ATP-dependent DNA helicase RecG
MSTTPEQLDLWRAAPSEHQRLEFKEAKTQFDGCRPHEYCVALANEGEYLLFGVAAKPPREVVGSLAFPDTVAAAEKRFQALGFRMDIEEVAHPQGRFEAVRGHGPKQPGAGLLPALRSEVGHGGADDQSVTARRLPTR